MSLLISLHFVKAGRVGGAEQMVYSLIDGFLANQWNVTALCSDPDELSQGFRRKFQRDSHARLLVCGGKGRRFIAEQRACLDGRVKGEAILFPNYFTPPVVPHRCGRVVTVIHDFQYRHFPQYFSAHKRAWLRFAHQLTFSRADAVVVVSEFVRDDVARLWGEKVAAKTVVIHDPVSWTRFGEGKDPHPLDGRPYVLTAAAQYPHKNLDTLIQAFRVVSRRDPDVQLVLAGQAYENLVGVPSRRNDILGLVSSLGLTNQVHITGFINSEQLGLFYRNATLFAYPSVFEGFGLPPVEALGFGVPTLTTRCASLPEVTLGRAVYVEDPYDAEEWAHMIRLMLERPARFEVSAETRVMIREHYAPEHIARRYAETLFAGS